LTKGKGACSPLQAIRHKIAKRNIITAREIDSATQRTENSESGSPPLMPGEAGELEDVASR
jgi:hypothetical protein